MGVKSTKYITREDAEEMLIGFLYGSCAPYEVLKISNEVLQEILPILNDAEHDGEGFENYWIEG